MIANYREKRVCMIGVVSEGKSKVTESSLRAKVNGLNDFTYFEVNLNNKKKLKRVASGLSRLVIRSELWRVLVETHP